MLETPLERWRCQCVRVLFSSTLRCIIMFLMLLFDVAIKALVEIREVGVGVVLRLNRVLCIGTMSRCAMLNSIQK